MTKQTQYFNVAPNSPIQGGNAAYTVDLDSGAIAYSASVIVKMLFSFTKQFNGNFQVDPKLLLSSGLASVGASQSLSGLTLTVLSIVGGVAHCSVTQAQLNGLASLDISGVYLRAISMETVANVMRKNIEIDLSEQSHLF